MSFQNGVDTIVSGCTTYGSTPSESTPTQIVASIRNIYNNRYTEGSVAADNRLNSNSVSYKTGYENGLKAGGSGKYEVVKGSKTFSTSYSTGTKSLSYATGYKGYTGYVRANASFILKTNSQSGLGVGITTAYDSTTGKVSVTISDSANLVQGFNGTVYLNWILYK